MITLVALLCIGMMFVMMFIGIPIALVLGNLSILGLWLGLGSSGLTLLGQATYIQLTDLTISALPLFIFMACIITTTSMGSDLFESMNKWLSWLPGGLVITGVLSQGMLGSVMSSSLTSMLTVGKASLPEMEKRGYDRNFSAGAIASAGAVASLIPPSGMMIIYAMFSGESLGVLFMAGLIPGIILCLMISIYIIFICKKRKDLAPQLKAYSWNERLLSIRKIWPIPLMMLFIIGGIYLGIVTPTESAAVGVIVALTTAVVSYHLRFKGIHDALIETVSILGIISFIFVTAKCFGYLVTFSQLPQHLASYLASLLISPWLILIAINLLLLILGCFLEGMSIVMITLPIFIPLIKTLGFDPVYFGVVMLVNMEIALITPPVGLTLFVMQGAFKISYRDIVRGVAPFILVLFIFLGLIIAFPQISLWLPNTMKG